MKIWARTLLGMIALAILPFTPVLAAESSTETTKDKSAAEEAGYDASLPIELEADKIYFNYEDNIVRAEGNVIAVHNGITLNATALEYDLNADVARALGPFTITDADGNQMTAVGGELYQDLEKGMLEGLKVTLANNAWLTADEAQRESPEFARLRNAAFSPCKVCEENPVPLWAIRASNVIHDRAAQDIRYKNARLEFFGVPVFWMPYFEHPDPSVERRSGLLFPSAGQDSELGWMAEIPYYWSITPHQDLTITPVITSKERAFLKAEYRQRFHTGMMTISGSGTYVNQRDTQNLETGKNEFRGHIFGNGKWRLDEHADYGFELARSSDDTYLRRYDFTNRETLTSRLFYEWISGTNHFYVDALSFQGLREFDDQSALPVVAPLIEHHYETPVAVMGGRISITSSLLGLYRRDGSDLARVTSDVDWTRNQILSTGDVITYTLRLRGALYAAQDVPDPNNPGQTIDNERDWMLEPLAAMEWRRPMVRAGERFTQVLEPTALLVIAPNNGDALSIPNEDSAAFEFSDSNLLSFDRFPGDDEWESGPRFVFGLKWGLFGPNGGGMTTFVGQNFRLRRSRDFDPTTGLDDQTSDIVGRTDLFFSKQLSFVHRYRLDVDSLDFKRNEVTLDMETDRIRVDLTYVALDKELTVSGLDDREEISTDVYVFFSQYWGIRGQVRYDLTSDGGLIRYRTGVVYEDECFYFELGIKRRFTSDRDLRPSTTIGVQINLLTLG